ncbi:hypothetical protein ALC57_09671, partial [Trachymyrmex cornetzi]
GLWTIEPSILSIIGYTVIIPVVSALGIIGNSLILVVHLKAKTYLKGSAYTYLAGRWKQFLYDFYTVLTTSNLITCVPLVFSGLVRGIFRCYEKLIIVCGWFNLQTWLQSIIFGLIAAYLLIANLIMIYLVRRAPQAERDVEIKVKTYAKEIVCGLMIMLVGIVFLFLVGELPTHLASRRSAVSLL